MKNTWTIVAKADLAKIYALEHHPRRLVLISQFEHPESRLKKNELLETEDGHHDSTGTPRGNTSYHSNARRNEHIAFAMQIEEFLQQGYRQQKFAELILIAEPFFHGFLNEKLAKPLQKIISKHIQKNYTDRNETELLQIISEKPDY
ncbi:MAG: hypothetical protein K0S11_53 [Gammaproteobacteria bacterium]|jgi:protein required for attachment to host cells|nr:hypothetical protein [Gammaproteobacteria bacterium]